MPTSGSKHSSVSAGSHRRRDEQEPPGPDADKLDAWIEGNDDQAGPLLILRNTATPSALQNAGTSAFWQARSAA